MGESGVEKLHAACDECRIRKLKCSGESPQCSRCAREGIRCAYSPQKQMGRPKKRRREDLEDRVPGNSSTSAMDESSTSTTADFGLLSPSLFSDLSSFPDSHNDDVLSAAIETPLPNDAAFANPYPQPSILSNDFPINPVIDPDLWDAQPIGFEVDHSISLGSHPTPKSTDEGPCACLSIMYLSLTELQGLSSFSFPAVMVPLRGAMNRAVEIIRCEKCPKEVFTTMQNVQSAMSLLSALSERFRKVLEWIDSETKRLEQTGEKKLYRVGDNDPSLMHLHTGTLDCPMGFNIELEPRDWKRLAKQSLRTQVLGGQGTHSIFLFGIVDEMEQRQNRWHAKMQAERTQLFGNKSADPADAGCIRMLAQIREIGRSMNWD